MTHMNYGNQARTASGINLVLGAWLIASPWIFGYYASAGPLSAGTWNSVVVGALILVIGLTRVVSLVGPGLARVNVVLGLWTIASPWIFGYAAGEPAMWNSIVVGIVITLLALWSANATVLRDRRESHLAAH
jgi:SPW repeat